MIYSGSKSDKRVNWEEDIENINGFGNVINENEHPESIRIANKPIGIHNKENLETKLITEIDWDDIQEKVNFWESSIVCNVS